MFVFVGSEVSKLLFNSTPQVVPYLREGPLTKDERKDKDVTFRLKNPTNWAKLRFGLKF